MPRRILLVDDDIAAIATIRRVLSREGLQVLLATSAADATIALDHHEPEVVLLAPGVDGRRGAGVRRHIRDSRRAAEIVVLLLGEGDDPVYEGDATFEKPVDPLAILAALRSDRAEVPAPADDRHGWLEEPGDSEPAPEEPPPPEERTVPRGDADAPDFFAGPSPWDAPPPAAEDAAATATAPPTPGAESLRMSERERASDLDSTRVGLARDEEEDVAARIDRAIAEVDGPGERDDPLLGAGAAPAPGTGTAAGASDAEEPPDAPERAASERAADERAAAERAEAQQAIEAARAEAEEARAASFVQAQEAKAIAERAARELAQLRAHAQEQVREAVAAARTQSSAELARFRAEAAAREEQLRQDLEAAHREQLERALEEARAAALEAMARAEEAALGRQREAVEQARKETAERAREALDARLREALEQTRTAMQEKARRAVAEVQAQGERHAREAVATLRKQLEEEAEARVARLRAEAASQLQEARQEARRALDKLRASAESALRRQQAEHAEALARMTAERDALADEREVSRSAADALHQRGEELRVRIAELEGALEQERRERADAAEAAAATLRRAEAEAERRTRDAVARAEDETRQRTEEALRREAQEEAQARADARRQAALEARRTPVPGLPAPSALLQHLRAPALVDVAELPFPTSEPVPHEEPIPEATPDAPLPAAGEFVDAGRLLARLHRTSATGKLELEIAGGRRTVWLERGRVCGAESELPGERLEEIAHREGLLSREQRAWARTAPAAGARQLAAMLSERGFLKAAELVPLVRRRVTEIVVSAFEHDGGRFTFTPEPVDPDERVLLPETTLAVITEGIRRKQIAPRLFARLGGPGTLLRPAPGGPALDDLGLTARERRVVGLADGLRTLDEVLLDAGADETLALGALWSAVVAGVLEVAVRGVPAAAEDGSLDRARIEEKSRQVREADYFQVLGVSRSCTAYEVDAAFERLAHEFAPARHAGLGDAAAMRALQEIQGVLSDAREVLRDDRLRREYARNLGNTGT